MKRACIAIVDASRARIYTFQEDAPPGQQLREIRDLINPGRRLKDHELFSESRPPLLRKNDHRRCYYRRRETTR